MVKLMGPGASFIMPSKYSEVGFLPEENTYTTEQIIQIKIAKIHCNHCIYSSLCVIFETVLQYNFVQH